MIIVDTNVIAYIIVPGETTDIAEAVRDKDPFWAAPWLWRSEMRNLLTLYLRRRILSLVEVQDHMASAEELLLGREYSVSSDKVLKLAADSGCTAYDCEFVCLAEELGTHLVTSDKKVLAAFPDQAISMAAFLEH